MGGFNLYQYAPNPLSWVDPWGLSKCGKDWGAWFSKETKTSPPETMNNPHAHHIVFKGDFSRSPPMQAALNRSRSILGKYSIDPVNDPDALMWAENKGHTLVNAQNVASQLENAHSSISKLNLSADDAANSMKSALKKIGMNVFGN
jgi:uncharacterized protein RhaS with RHS repeats